MPLKPPPLRLLRSPLPATHLSFSMSFHSLRHQPPRPPVPLFSRIFPFKLKYQALGLGLGLGFPPNNTRHSSSSSARRPRAGPRSLIEDEDELDGWVSKLRTGSLRAGAFTEDEEEEEERSTGGRKRGRNLDGDGEGLGRVGRRGVRVPSNSSPTTSRFGGREREFGARKDREFGSRGQRGGARGGIHGGGARRAPLLSDEEEVGGYGSRGREMESGGRNGREFGSRGQRGGARGGVRGGARGGGRMGRVENASVKRASFMSEEEDDGDEFKGEKSVSSFIDLIGDEEDSEEDSGIEEEEDEHEIRSRSSLFGNDGEKQSSKKPSSSSEGSDSYLSETRFDQCPVSPLSLKAIKDVGYEKMTVVQEATLPVILKGKDVLAKARTGTGKTVAFLLPSIEVVLKSPPPSRDQKLPPILVLVICPTRELATQAATEAKNLVKYHPSVDVQVVIGGTRIAVEQKRMQANPCQILVATPGRLKDHLENTSGFATRLKGVKVLVLDEADHLLDMGFRRDIERIIAAVPKQRQTLLFSATIPDEVRQICHVALKRDHEFINTVEEGSGETHSQVRQTHLVAPLEDHFSLLYSILKEHISDDINYKVLVFCTTAMVTRLVADLLGELNLNVREIHSRKPQSYRTRVSDEFRKSKGLILVTSDVSARGVDYPDVTLVIQIGLPSDREQYIHRLGRTGRKGKEGQGILLLAPWEEFFLSSVKDLPITKAKAPMVDPDTRRKVERALSHVEMKNKEAAYQAWLGYYNSNKTVGRDKIRLVELANEFSRTMGLDKPPAIQRRILGKMGLSNVPGLRTQ